MIGSASALLAHDRIEEAVLAGAEWWRRCTPGPPLVTPQTASAPRYTNVISHARPTTVSDSDINKWLSGTPPFDAGDRTAPGTRSSAGLLPMTPSVVRARNRRAEYLTRT